MSRRRRLGSEISRRFWWLDVVYPVTLALLLFSGLTYVIYAGQKQMQLSLLAEDETLATALRISSWFTSPPVTKSPEIRTITVSDSDLQNLGTVRGPKLRDVPVETYVAALDRLAEAGPARVYLRLLPGLYDLTPGDLEPLAAAIRRHAGRLTVRVVFPRRQAPTLPESIRAEPVLDDEPCREYPEINIRCSFSADWTDWAVQNVGDESRTLAAAGVDGTGDSRRTTADSQLAPWASDQFAIGGQSYVLNLPDQTLIPDQSMTSLVRGGLRVESAADGKPRMVFIGQALAFSEPESQGSANNASSWVHTPRAESVHGTPLHVFLAQVAAMHAGDQFIAVPRREFVIAATVLFCLMIMAQLVTLDASVALGTWFVFALTAPVANAIAMRSFGAYLPVVDIAYFGLATLVTAGFARLSQAALERFRIEERSKLHAWTTDVKSNFISLLSHNLNTPIAKMQGTLSLLAIQPSPGLWRSDIRRAEALVAQLDLVVKAVLLSSALDENASTTQAISLERLASDALQQSQGVLRRLGITLTMARTDSPQDQQDKSEEAADALRLPRPLDARSITSAITCAAALFAPPQSESSTDPTTVRMQIGVPETVSSGSDPGKDKAPILQDSENGIFWIRLHCDTRWLTASALAILESPDGVSLRSRMLGDFVTDVAASLVVQVVQTSGVAVSATPVGRGGFIDLVLAEAKPASID